MPRLGQGAFRVAFQAVFRVHPFFFDFGLWCQSYKCLGFDGERVPLRAVWQTK